jgi:DNA mismatch endonuclease (patch repair protein)
MMTPRSQPWPDVPEPRRRIMASIRGRNTKPELVVRRLLHSLGYRYRVHLRVAGGRPDIAFPKRRKAIFVHGCFWHGHDVCRSGRLPATRVDYWRNKIETNRERDKRHLQALGDDGWQALVLWECEIAARDSLAGKLQKFLGPTKFGSGSGS